MCRFFLLAFLFLSAAVYGSDTTNQTVTMSVSAINEIAITGSAPTLNITTAVAGSAPTSSSSAGITYGITTNETGKKITGSIDTTMPSGTTLTVNLGAPSGASSGGDVTLTTISADLVTGIGTLNQAGLSLTYSFSATAEAGVLNSFSRTATFTIVDGA